MTTPREAIAVTGIIAIFSIILMSIATIPSSSSITGDVIAEHQETKNFKSFDEIIPYQIDDFDYNMDGLLEYDDFNDLIEGKLACVKGKHCDLDEDGYLDKRDQVIFDSIVRKIYDYNNDFKLNQKDIEIFMKVMNEEVSAQDYYVYDLNYDGELNNIDLDLLTRIIYG